MAKDKRPRLHTHVDKKTYRQTEFIATPNLFALYLDDSPIVELTSNYVRDQIPRYTMMTFTSEAGANTKRKRLIADQNIAESRLRVVQLVEKDK